MAPWMSTDSTPSRLITTPDWLVALFVQVRWTDVELTAFALRFDGGAGTTVSPADEAALAVDTVHIAAITAKATTSTRLLDLATSLFMVPHPSVLFRYPTRPILEKEPNRVSGLIYGTGATLPLPGLGSPSL